MMRGIMWWALLAGCDTPAPPADIPLDPTAQLTRLSLDLRGVRPSAAELAAMEEDPSLYPQFVDRFLDDPRFEKQVKDWFNLRFLTRTGAEFLDAEALGVQAPASMIADTLAEEPLALVGHIVEEDLPITELVRADYTMASPLLAALYDLERAPSESDPGGEGGEAAWTVARYRDDRPMAGVLSMTTMWQVYPSMGGNANRHRANAVSRTLLCDDFLTRPIVLNRAAVDQLTEDPEAAISTNPGCQSCHSTLDPLAANFFGFFHEDDPEDPLVTRAYFPENEEGWRSYSGKAPAYFGRPVSGLTELGDAIAEDPRFLTCMARTVWEGVTQRTYSDADWSELQGHVEDFYDGGLQIRPLVRSIVLSPAYTTADFADDATDARVPTLKLVSPEQLAASVEQITGYRWVFDGRDGLTTPDRGLPVLAGGVDGQFVRAPSRTPSVGLVFIQERLAWSAAWSVASHDLDPTSDSASAPRLLTHVTRDTTPTSNPSAFEAQIEALHRAVLGRPLPDDDPLREALPQLWVQVYGLEGSPVAAWAAVMTVLLRDPSLLLY